jgi:hypothetical protein
VSSQKLDQGGSKTPAQGTYTSGTIPNCLTLVVISSWSEAQEETSHFWKATSDPGVESTNFWASGTSLRSPTRTRAPCEWQSLANARPMPKEGGEISIKMESRDFMKIQLGKACTRTSASNEDDLPSDREVPNRAIECHRPVNVTEMKGIGYWIDLRNIKGERRCSNSLCRLVCRRQQ